MSELMREFLQSWLDWAEDDAPWDTPFTRQNGLCSNLDALYTDAVARQLHVELMGMFSRDSLSTTYPFGYGAYNDAAYHDTQHKDEARLAWVRKQLEQA